MEVRKITIVKSHRPGDTVILHTGLPDVLSSSNLNISFIYPSDQSEKYVETYFPDVEVTVIDNTKNR